VTAIIPHYGEAAPTRALVHALLAQGATSGLVQVIVVDDCSPEPFLSDAAGVVVIRRQTNGGFGSAVNAGAEVSTGDLLLILNSDLEIPDSFVADFVAASRPWMPAVTSPLVVDSAGEEAWTGRRFPRVHQQAAEWLTPLARWRSRGHLHDLVGRDTRSYQAASDVPVDFVVGAAMLVPREMFREVGGFDERFYMNSEEADLQYRLRHLGVPSIALRSPVVVHEGGGSSDPARRRAWVVTSRLSYAEKWGHPRTLRIALTVASAINYLWNAPRQVLGRDVDARKTFGAERHLIWARTAEQRLEQKTRPRPQR
jgi:N-acetylglucosaminyl-diphospho-decaprenol L-rhamnosyltransferase